SLESFITIWLSSRILNHTATIITAPCPRKVLNSQPYYPILTSGIVASSTPYIVRLAESSFSSTYTLDRSRISTLGSHSPAHKDTFTSTTDRGDVPAFLRP